jgi:Asp-tRNA(Asn)/Glu-tRNA(Gln) amidotransferase A subunit family amidase
VVGLKVTYGALPYHGYTGANSSLSGPGAFARDGADARLLLEALLARELPSGDGGGGRGGVASGEALRVGVVRHPFWEAWTPMWRPRASTRWRRPASR